MEYDFWDDGPSEDEEASMNDTPDDGINEWYQEQMQDLAICFPSEV